MADQNNTDGLIGVDPDDTMDFEMGGAKFTIGTIPGDVWERLSAEHNLLTIDSTRRCIKRIVDRGELPEDWYIDRKGRVSDSLTKVQVESAGDPVYRAARIPVMTELAKYAVRGHEKFLTRKKTPVPLDRDENGLKETTLRYYRVNQPILEAIWLNVYLLNGLGDVGKKV